MTKLEQVARAAYEKFNENLMGDLEPTWEACDPSFKARLIESIRAAVEELRQPTDGMLDYRDAFVKKSDALLVWQHQIDAILSEKPDGGGGT